MGPHLGGPPSGAAPATGALASRCTRRPARTRWRCHRRPLWPGAPGGGPQRARQRPRVTTSPGRSLAQGLATVVPGRPSRMAPARRPAQVDGPTDSVTRVHSGIAWGCGGPCLAPPAGAVRLTAKTGLPTPGLSLAIGRYCLSESLRPTVVSRRKPGGPRPMRGQRSLPLMVCSATCLAARTWSRAHIEELVGTLVRRQRRRFEPITRAGCRSALTAPSLW